MNTRTRVSVVIPARNAEATIAAQIEALSDQTVDDFDIVVVDNGSVDHTVECARAAAGTIQILVVHEPNVGANRARNTGVRSAPGDVILLCDADDIVDSSWVQELSARVAAGRWAYGAIDRRRLNHPFDVDLRSHLVGPRSHDYLDVVGTNCGFHRSDWTRVGGFDELLSGYGDETEFFLRMHQAGIDSEYVPEAIAHYRLRPGPKAFLRDRFREGVNHRRITRLDPRGNFVGHIGRTRIVVMILAHVALLFFSWPNRIGRWRRLGTISYYLGRASLPDRRRFASVR